MQHLKIISYILFVYIGLFYILGSDNLRSIYDCMTDEIEYVAKEVKKEMEEKEDEESKEKNFFCDSRLTLPFFFGSGKTDHIMISESVDCKHIANIFIPPPNFA